MPIWYQREKPERLSPTLLVPFQTYSLIWLILCISNFYYRFNYSSLEIQWFIMQKKYLSLSKPERKAPHRRPKNVTCWVSFKRGSRSQTRSHSWIIVLFHSNVSWVQDLHEDIFRFDALISSINWVVHLSYTT